MTTAKWADVPTTAKEFLTNNFGAPFNDFAGSVVVHAMGGWIALAAVILLGARRGRYSKDGKLNAFPPSSIPFLALGSWILTAALVVGKNDPGFLYNGPLAGLVAVCAGSNLFHPLGALATGLIAGALFVWTFSLTQNKWKIDDVLGVWPLHGICGAWGGVAAGIFGLASFGGLGGVTFSSQLIGTITGISVAFIGGYIIYSIVKSTVGIRLTEEEEFDGADITIHKINSVSSDK